MLDTKPNISAQKPIAASSRDRISKLLALLMVFIALPAAANWGNLPNLSPQTPEQLIEASDDHIWITLEDYVAPPITPAAAHNDLLQRLRDGFALDEAMNNRIQAELNWYVKHPDYLNRVFTRSQRGFECR